ncbi:cobyrinate a,c-diamide synthase [Massilia sp. W12]|uniref:cobyrinate a,c-diamide synthase n=1 Tax=Massilia sp. W12 TaxID=3126507 RepID=UPI0030CEFCC7
MSAAVLMLAALASGQGKTTSCAALALHARAQGQRVALFKVGTDFIDPMILQQAAGVEVGMLDLWVMGAAACRAALAQAAASHDLVLIEAVMGLYDGQPSAADLARALDLPVLLVIDCAALAQTAGAIAHGLQSYGGLDVCGLLANRVGSAFHADLIGASLRNCLLAGWLPPQAQAMPERHLGLVTPQEQEDVRGLLQRAADSLQLTPAWPALLARAQRAWPDAPPAPPPALLAGRTIAVARDAASCFLYPQNLALLQAMGAQLRFFSPLADQAPPPADAIWLPGGYPELHAAALSRAQHFMQGIRAAHQAGVAIWAECGGMMMLCDSLLDGAGQAHAMAGILPAQVRVQSRIAGLGPQAWASAQGELRGHVFHFSQIESAAPAIAHCQTHPQQQTGAALYQAGSLRASWFHPWFASNPAATAALFGVGHV